ncbi:MAG TPA: hypothetical protein CFH81_02195 [Sulfurovum sp. UBA12169]|nr:MAG TPA: hypothetical protein CFH81_02195 [Sulfurovum sp. UBA12169]
MAMIKYTDITPELIAKDFPAVYASIVASAAQGSPAVTAESLKASHPDVVAQIMEEGKAQADVNGAIEQERVRIASINALARPGVESIIAEALADANMSANDVKIKLFDADQDKRSTALSQHKDNGEKLGKQLEQLSNPEGADGQPQEKKDAAHGSIMKKLTGGKQ